MANLVKSNTPTSIKNKWGTDPLCFLDGEGLFKKYTGKDLVLDVCAEPQTAKVDRYYLSPDWVSEQKGGLDALKVNNLPRGGKATCVGFDALQCPWEDGWWCNPPFDDKIPFIRKAVEEMFKGNDGMMLLPYEPLSGWWRREVHGYASVEFRPDGRYQFYEADGYTRKSGANFGSVLVMFTRRKIETPYRSFFRYQEHI